MTDSTNASAPSDKQIALAQKLAGDKGVDLPDGYDADWRICKSFIDANITKFEVSPPSDKQIWFAEKLAKEQKTKLPKDYKKDWRICSDFIKSMQN